MKIRALLLSAFRKYMPYLLRDNKILQLRTPLIALYKGKDIKEFFFDFSEFNAWQKNNDIKKFRIKYFKGLGSWQADDLAKLIDIHGKDMFFEPFVFDEDANETILNWFVSDRVEYRKNKLLANEFNIAMV